jgi:flagellar hook-basal body complex protein FliE
MLINSIEQGSQFLPLVNSPGDIKISGTSADGPSFSGTLKELMSDVNNLQNDSYDLTEKMVKGEPVDIHEVMIASEKAKTSFQLLMEMRNKFLDMYREVSRIQI